MKTLEHAKWNDIKKWFDNGMLIPKMHMDVDDPYLSAMILLCQESTRWHETAKKAKIDVSHLPMAPINTGFFNNDGDWVSVYNFQTYLNNHQKIEYPFREIELYHAVVREAENQGHLMDFLYKESHKWQPGYLEAGLGM